MSLTSKQFSVYLNGDRLVGAREVDICFDVENCVAVKLVLDVEDVELDTEAKTIRLKVLTEDTFWAGVKEKQDKN